MDLVTNPSAARVSPSRTTEARTSMQTFSDLEHDMPPSSSIEPSDNNGDAGTEAGIETSNGDDDMRTIDENTVGQEIEMDPLYESLEAHDKANGAVILDPSTGQREYWRDPITALQREIWCPGDGDGDKTTDYYDKPGPAAPMGQRWRFFQSRVGPGVIKAQVNEPPKYVILDDRIAYELLASDLPRSYLTKHWPHDFGGNGSIRSRRPNRGRGAIGDFEATGRDRFHFGRIGNKKDGERYYFTGEPDYKPIIWNTNDWQMAIGVFKPYVKKLTSPPPKKQLKPNQHGHNQFTPPDQLVKNGGAPHKGKSSIRYGANTNDPKAQERGRNLARALLHRNNGGAMAGPTIGQRIQHWRLGARSVASSVRENSLVPSDGDGPTSVKRLRLASVSVAGDEADDSNYFERMMAERAPAQDAENTDDPESYAKDLEMHLLTAKDVLDEQRVKNDRLERELAEAKARIKELEDQILAF